MKVYDVHIDFGNLEVPYILRDLTANEYVKFASREFVAFKTIKEAKEYIVDELHGVVGHVNDMGDFPGLFGEME